MHTLRLTFLALLPFTLQVSNLAAQPQNPGGPGGGQGGNQNKLSVIWSSTASQPNDKLSNAEITITGPLTLQSSTTNTPHQEGLQGQAFEVAASTATTYSITGSGTNYGNLSTNATSSFAIWSNNFENASAWCRRLNQNNTAKIRLTDRSLKPNGSGYTAFTGYVHLVMSLAGEPVNLLLIPPAVSASHCSASMELITGEYEHAKSINGTLHIAWSFTYIDHFGTPITKVYDPEDPLSLPYVATELTVTFNETNSTDIPIYEIILDTLFSMDHESYITSAMTGIGAAGSFSAGQCAVTVGSSSGFQFVSASPGSRNNTIYSKIWGGIELCFR